MKAMKKISHSDSKGHLWQGIKDGFHVCKGGTLGACSIWAMSWMVKKSSCEWTGLKESQEKHAAESIKYLPLYTVFI